MRTEHKNADGMGWALAFEYLIRMGLDWMDKRLSNTYFTAIRFSKNIHL